MQATKAICISQRIVRSEAPAVHKKRIPYARNRLDAPGAAILAATLVIALITAVPHAGAANDAHSSAQSNMQGSAARPPNTSPSTRDSKANFPSPNSPKTKPFCTP